MVYDYHTHTNYSDGDFMWRMANRAEKIGLDGIGFADHCNLSDDTRMRNRAKRNGFSLDIDEVCKRRNEALSQLSKKYDIEIFNAIEFDYHPEDVQNIRDYLARHSFDYRVGSVHHVEVKGTRRHIMVERFFEDLSKSEKQQVVDKYFEYLVKLVKSNLFDIVAHADVFERNRELRGLATEQHYRKFAEALSSSDAVTEINGGRINAEYGKAHPNNDLLEILIDEGVKFTLGSDAHNPKKLEQALPEIRKVFSNHDIEPHKLSLDR